MHEEFEDLGQIPLDKNRNGVSNGDEPSSSSSNTAAAQPSIRILQITDLHCFPKDCESWEGISLENSHSHCLKLIDQLVQDTQPDVIVLTGDIMDGRGPWASADSVTETMQDLITVFHNVPWAFIPGNHDDDESPWSREDLVKLFQLPGCLQQKAKGFHHTLLLTKGSQQSVKVRIYLFDSGGNHPDPKIMYYSTPTRAIRGFQEFASSHVGTEESNAIGLVYIHIPTPEYEGLDPVIGTNRLFEAALVAGKIPFPFNHLTWLVKLLKKDRIAGCTRGGHDTGLFQALLDAKTKAGRNITAVFCGHDHHSDAVFWRNGIFLGYGRSGSMTPPYDWEGKSPNAQPQGARVVEVSAHGTTSATTWIQTHVGVEENSFLDMTDYEPAEACGCWTSQK